MLKGLRSVVFVGFALIAGIACTVGSSPSGAALTPQQQAQITSPSTGLQITASITAATLGEACATATGGSFAAPSADCAGTPPSSVDAGTSTSTDGGAAKGSGLAPGCGGPSYCQQSNVQLALVAGAGAGGQSAHLQIVSVTLHDAASGALVDTLTASKPQVWTGNSYAAWDEAIKPAGDLKASYDLTAPEWSKILSAPGVTTAYGNKYRLHVTLRVDGVEVILESIDLTREPMVAT
jgi:hypothetical protein